MTFAQQVGVLLLLALVVLATIFWVFGSDKSVDSIWLGVVSVAPVEFQNHLLRDPSRILLDIRTPQEFHGGHLSRAINLDYYNPSFTQQLDQLDRDTPIAIYCRSGSRSSNTLTIMKGMGFTNVIELQGGVLAWQEDFDETVCPGRVC